MVVKNKMYPAKANKVVGMYCMVCSISALSSLKRMKIPLNSTMIIFGTIFYFNILQ